MLEFGIQRRHPVVHSNSFTPNCQCFVYIDSFEKPFSMSGLSWISKVRHNLCSHLRWRVYGHPKPTPNADKSESTGELPNHEYLNCTQTSEENCVSPSNRGRGPQ